MGARIANKFILTQKIREQRMTDYYKIEKKHGWIATLARKWDIDMRNVLRFLEHQFRGLTETEIITYEDMEQRIGKDLRWLPGYKESTAATKEGKIFHYSRHYDRVYELNPCPLKNGYLITKFTDKYGNRKSALVAPLILEAWKPKPHDGKKYYVSYFDRNRMNLNVSNLNWVEYRRIGAKNANRTELIKGEEIHSFRGLNDARLFLKRGNTKELREAAKKGTEIKGYKVKVYEKPKY